MQVKIKRLSENAVIPKYALEGDAGLDLVATTKWYDEFGNVHYGTGLAFQIPNGFVGLLFPRSSNAKKDLILSNSVGVIDSNYTGEISFKFKPSAILYSDVDNPENKIGVISETFDDIILPSVSVPFVEYKVGDRIGQIIILPYPEIEFVEVDELTETNRGTCGYGSTGN